MFRPWPSPANIFFCASAPCCALPMLSANCPNAVRSCSLVDVDLLGRGLVDLEVCGRQPQLLRYRGEVIGRSRALPSPGRQRRQPLCPRTIPASAAPLPPVRPMPAPSANRPNPFSEPPPPELAFASCSARSFAIAAPCSSARNSAASSDSPLPFVDFDAAQMVCLAG